MKHKLKFRIFKIFVIGIIVALAFNLASPNFLQNDSTAQAVGDLSVDWGIGTGDVGPIFVVNNMMPGQTEERSVSVINNASTARPVGVRGVKNSETGDLATVLDIKITEGLTTLYSATLSQFFTDSSGIDGIPLSTLAPSASTTYTFKVTFQESAENEFQNASVVFDLIAGIAFEVPAECSDMNFSGNPIFGTSGNDNIKGTNFNDLIIAFEGDDKVNGSNGDDCIIGGEDNDKLDGSNGNDVIFGNDGDDRIYGSNGNDEIDAGGGNDQVEGSNGNDDIILGSGNDKADGGNGNDYVEGSEGNDEIRGRNGNDTLFGGSDSDIARGDLGVDTCDAETEISCEL